MATLSTAVVNAGYPNTGTPSSVPRGVVKFFSSVKEQNSVLSGAEYNLKIMTASTLSTGDTTPRASKIVLGSVNEVKQSAVPFFSSVKTIYYAPEIRINITAANTNLAANSINSSTITSVNEEPIIVMQYANIDKTLATRLTTLITSVNEGPIGTTKFFSKEISIVSVNEEPVQVMNKDTFNITLGTRDSLTIAAVNEESIGTTKFFSKEISITSVNEEPVQVMNKDTFNITLGTRDSLKITSVSEESVMVLNVSNTYTAQHSPMQLANSEEPVIVIDRNTNLTTQTKQLGSAIQPKGTEAGNIGFAQAFGNTTITGKWF